MERVKIALLIIIIIYIYCNTDKHTDYSSLFKHSESFPDKNPGTWASALQSPDPRSKGPESTGFSANLSAPLPV